MMRADGFFAHLNGLTMRKTLEGFFTEESEFLHVDFDKVCNACGEAVSISILFFTLKTKIDLAHICGLPFALNQELNSEYRCYVMTKI